MAATDPTELEALRLHFNSLSMEQRFAFLESLSPAAYRYLKYCTDVFLWDKQIIPSEGYLYYLMMGGRGSSKTFTLCHEIKRRLMRGDPGLMAISASYQDMQDVLIPSILEQFPEDQPAVANWNKKIITAPNGNTISLKSAEVGIIKGRNTTTCFIDELSECWATSDQEKQLYYWRVLDGNIRKGNAQMIMSTNPETTPIFRHLYELHINSPEICKLVHSSIHDNPYLDPIKKDSYVKQWKGTRYEKMQLEGILDWTTDGALWTQELINKTRISLQRGAMAPPATFQELLYHIANPPNQRQVYTNPLGFFWRFVIAIDPAMSVSETSDETGIIIAAIGKDNHVYILEDLSGKWMPDDVGEIVQQARLRYPNLKVIVETNNGGFWITNALRVKDPTIDNNIIPLKVSQGKMTRAQHIVVIWDQLTAHLVGHFPKLEQQMLYYTGQANQKSPDRFDAMVMCCQYLAFEQIVPTTTQQLPRW
jgi:phage terminase large subunit-like protein